MCIEPENELLQRGIDPGSPRGKDPYRYAVVRRGGSILNWYENKSEADERATYQADAYVLPVYTSPPPAQQEAAGADYEALTQLQVALERIADMKDRDGNAIEMHRDELRAIAKSALRATVQADVCTACHGTGLGDGADYLPSCPKCSPAPQQAASAGELHFNAQRLRNVAKLVGLENAVPEDDETLDGARGSVLGMIARKLRANTPTVEQMTAWLESEEGKAAMAASQERCRAAQRELDKARKVTAADLSAPYFAQAAPQGTAQEEDWIDLRTEKPGNAEPVRVKLDNGSVVYGQRYEKDGSVIWNWDSAREEDVYATATHFQHIADTAQEAAAPSVSSEREAVQEMLRELDQKEETIYRCSNPACGVEHTSDPRGHCPVCIAPTGAGWSCYPDKPDPNAKFPPLPAPMVATYNQSGVRDGDYYTAWAVRHYAYQSVLRAALVQKKAPVPVIDERQEFERTFCNELDFRRWESNDEYVSTPARWAWQGWQERAALASPAPRELNADEQEALRMVEQVIPFRLDRIAKEECVDTSIESIRFALGVIRTALMMRAAPGEMEEVSEQDIRKTLVEIHNIAMDYDPCEFGVPVHVQKVMQEMIEAIRALLARSRTATPPGYVLVPKDGEEK